MPTVTFTVSAGWVARTRDAIKVEQPALVGQSNAVVDEAARVRVRQLYRDWVHGIERAQAAITAQNGVAAPNDTDIT